MLRQVRVPPSNLAEVVCPEARAVLDIGRGVTMRPEVSPFMLQCVSCGTLVLAASQIGVSISMSAGLVQRQVNLESCTRHLHMVTPQDEVTGLAPQVSPVTHLAVGR